jgi:hypothetical protein
MTPFDCITGILLVAVVVLQMRVRTLTLCSLLLRLGLLWRQRDRDRLAEPRFPAARSAARDRVRR